jgi:hypothetical protein
VDRLAIDVPLGDRDTQHRERDDGGNDVHQIVDEIDAAGLDLLVEARADHLVDEGNPLLHGGGGQIRIEYRTELPMFGVVHLEDPAAHTGRPDGGGDHDPLVTPPYSLDVAVVRCVPVELVDGCSVVGVDRGLVDAHGVALSWVRWMRTGRSGGNRDSIRVPCPHFHDLSSKNDVPVGENSNIAGIGLQGVRSQKPSMRAVHI